MGDAMLHVDEGTIHAWLDGALTPGEATRVEQHAASCAACAERVAEARGLIAASSRILSALDDVPGNVIPGGGHETDQLAAIRRLGGTSRRPWWRQRQLLAAASLLLVAGTGTVVWLSLGVDGTTRSVPTEAPAARDLEAGRTVAAPRETDLPQRDEALRRQRQDTPRPPASGRTGNVVATSDSTVISAKAEVADSVLKPMTMVVTTGAATAANEARADQPRPAAPAVASPLTAGTTQAGTAVQRLQQGLARATQDAAAQQGAMSLAERKTVPGAPSAAGVATGVDSLLRIPSAEQMAKVRARQDSGRSGTAESAPVGCYELRGPLPMGGRLLGVPELVRLTSEITPQGRDSAWRRALALSPVPSAARIELIWRMLDSSLVELRVRRPLDSSIVRFHSRPVGAPLSMARTGTGVEIAEARRVVCGGDR